jgi:serine/threonine protein kinase
MLGYLHCDLRPCNILIDEYGILKISDFKLTKKIPKAVLGSAPMSSRGTPLYMAPELFSAEGVHSYASDFWSLGCLIFELRMGGQPFSCRWWQDEDTDGGGAGDGRVPDIVDNIRTKELTHILQQMVVQHQLQQQTRGSGSGSRGGSSGGRHSSSSQHTPSKGKNDASREEGVSYVPSMSRELFDVLAWLLEKVPHHRCDWCVYVIAVWSCVVLNIGIVDCGLLAS